MSLRAHVPVANERGLRARPATRLVAVAKAFDADVSIQCGERSADGKDLLAVLGLAITGRSAIVVEAHGPDQAEAIGALIQLIARLAEAD